MPNRRRPAAPRAAALATRAPKQTFRQRFGDLDAERTRLLERLAALGEHASGHPSHKRVLTLLNTLFRRASVAQRPEILRAAAWLIDLLERLSPAL